MFASQNLLLTGMLTDPSDVMAVVPLVPFSSLVFSDTNFRGESDICPAEGFTLRLAPPMGTDVGLGLDEALVFKSRASMP